MFLDEKVNFRLRDDETKIIRKIVKKSKDIYDSESHFYRVAVLKLIRTEKARLKL